MLSMAVTRLSNNLAFLQGHGKHLNDYRLPQPSTHSNEVKWELHHWLPQVGVLQQQVDTGLLVFNSKQQDIFLQVQHAILNNKLLLMSVDGKAGCGKTFLVNTLCAWVQSIGRAALPTTTSVFVAQLYPGGQTIHSTFGIGQQSMKECSFLTQLRFLSMNIMSCLNLQLSHITSVLNCFEDVALLSGTKCQWQTMQF